MKRRFRHLAFLAALILGGGLLGACSVAGDDEGVWVKHPANQFIIARRAAEKHCREAGKRARHLSTSEERGTDLWIFTSRISLFACDSA